MKVFRPARQLTTTGHGGGYGGGYGGGHRGVAQGRLGPGLLDALRHVAQHSHAGAHDAVVAVLQGRGEDVLREPGDVLHVRLEQVHLQLEPLEDAGIRLQDGCAEGVDVLHLLLVLGQLVAVQLLGGLGGGPQHGHDVLEVPLKLPLQRERDVAKAGEDGGLDGAV
eukprot:1190334-Prorocentrum_minimum.AAC.4